MEETGVCSFSVGLGLGVWGLGFFCGWGFYVCAFWFWGVWLVVFLILWVGKKNSFNSKLPDSNEKACVPLLKNLSLSIVH